MQGYRPAQGPPPQKTAAESPASDRLDLSAAARSFDPEAEAARVMEGRIQNVRGQIAADTYLTDEKLDYVIDRLYAKLVDSPARAR